jgi:hypothetical protein
MPVVIYDIVHQLNGAKAFLDSQTGLLPEEAVIANMSGLAKSIESQIALSADMTVTNASTLNVAIANSAFSNCQKQTLAAAVNVVLTSQSMQSQHTKKTQTISNATSFFTAGDWAVFESPVHSANKVGRMIERLRLLGVVHPSEVSLKACAALLAAVHCPGAASTELHSLVLDLKVAMGRVKKLSITVPYLSTFPATPGELKPEHYKLAYPDASDPPVHRDVPSWSTMVARVPVRSTHKSLAANRHQPCAVLPQQPITAQNMMQALMQMISQHAAPRPPFIQLLVPQAPTQDTGASSSQQQSPLFQRRFSLSPTPLALQDGPTADAATLGQERDEVAGGGVSALDTIARLEAMAAGSSAAAGDTRASKTSARAAVAKPTPQTPSKKPKAVAKPKAKVTSKMTKASAKPKATVSSKKVKAAASVGAKVQPSVAMKAKASARHKASATVGSKLTLGCGKCRGSHVGCAQCRDPRFSGRRFQR